MPALEVCSAGLRNAPYAAPLHKAAHAFDCASRMGRRSVSVGGCVWPWAGAFGNKDRASARAPNNHFPKWRVLVLFSPIGQSLPLNGHSHSKTIASVKHLSIF